jgi:hypothetical protein
MIYNIALGIGLTFFAVTLFYFAIKFTEIERHS